MYRSAVGIVTCNSAQYIQEIILHNYLVGFDQIIVCLDRCDDDTFVQIQKLPSHVLEHVDAFNNSPHTNTCGFQFRAYQAIYDRYKGQVEWLAMFDDDEYFYDHRQRTINDLLKSVPDRVSQICVPWLKFTHSKQVLSAPPEVTRLNYFTMREQHAQIECKTIVRLGHVVPNNIRAGWYHCHYADVSGQDATFDNFEPRIIRRLDNPCRMIPENWNTCLAHYIHGSLEDFIKKYRKWKREKETLNIPFIWSFDAVAQNHGHVEDRRMSLYASELQELLKQCQ